jgi:hypothetical protein
VQAAIQLAIPCFSKLEHTNLSQIAWPWFSFVPGLAGRIASSKPASLLQSDQRMPHLLFRQSGHQQQRRNWVMMQFSPGGKSLPN